MIKEVHGGNIYKFDHMVYDFSANLNPLGMPKEVKQALIDHIDDYESYPDPANRELTLAIGTYHQVEPARICCGNGAADLIFRIALALRPAKALIVSPTFSEYEESLILAGSQIEHYFLKAENGFTLEEEILECLNDSLDMIFLCNPNNPTGIPVKKELVLAIAKRCAALDITLVVDECFTEFLEEESRYSIMDEIQQLSGVVILKAFTKIYAMAGLRLGYCVCSDYCAADLIRNCMQPWSVSTVASKAGVAALGLEGFVEKTKAYIKENRLLLMDGLKNLGYEIYPSAANYVFFRSEKKLTLPLAQYNILIRSCANYITLDTGDTYYYRIAVRTKEENLYFLNCLEKVTKEDEVKRNG